MVAVFPLSKLAFLFVKQVARPLSSAIRRRAVKSVIFREKFCLPPARLYNWCEVRMKMYVMNIGSSSKKTVIPRLNEEAAIELGSNLLGEGVIFSIAVAVLGYEYSRQKDKERKIEEEEENYKDSLENRINELNFANEELDTKVRELTRLLYSVQHEVKVRSADTLSSPVKPESTLKAESSSSTSDGTIVQALVDAKSRIKAS